MVDLRQMRQFIAVAETLNFRKAAQRLNMSQPPLSVAIRRLEEELGVLLLTRGARSTALTSAGQIFLEESRKTLLQAEQACLAAKLSAAGLKGSIRLGFIDSVVHGLPNLLRRFQHTHPNVEIELIEATPSEQIESLRLGRLDLGILVMPVVAPQDIKFEPLFEDRMIAALCLNHPLATFPKIALRDLAEESWIIFCKHHGPEIHSSILTACGLAGFVPRIAQRPRHMQTTAGLVAGNVGVALMPSICAQAIPGLLICREIIGPGTPVPYLLALAYRELNACTRSLLNEALAIAEETASDAN